MPQPAYGLTFRDYEGSLGTTEINTGLVTALTLPALLTQVGDLRTAIDAIVIGVIADERQTVFNTILSQDYPASQNAQRGNKWVVYYHDTTQFFDAPVNAIPNAGYLKPFHIMIPTADNTLLADNEKDLDITANPGLAFVTAFEAVAKSPYGGSVAVDKIEQLNVNA